MKDIENKVNLECEMLGLEPRAPAVGPEIVHGIEISPLAAELARTTIWIGDIQWRLRNGINAKPQPILRKLDAIECRNALLFEAKGVEASWPDAEFIVGNPPFLGSKLLRSELTSRYVDQLFSTFEGRVPRESDLVMYWFEKAAKQITSGKASRAGLVSTNSIRQGANRKLFQKLTERAPIFTAYSDEAWVVDGASVRVSLICFGQATENEVLTLDGRTVAQVNSDLTSSRDDLTTAKRLSENAGIAFMGDTKGGAFDIPGAMARTWLSLPNPNGRSNSDVLKPWLNGIDITRRPTDTWIIDFGWTMNEREASLYEAPFKYALEHIKPVRSQNRREHYAKFWWRHVEPRPGMWRALRPLTRYIGTVVVAKYRLFVWIAAGSLPDHRLILFARDDDTTFGILHSRFHECWSLSQGSTLEDRPAYTPTTTFETFPFPDGLTPKTSAKVIAENPHAIAIADAAKRLSELRDRWLNPPEWADVVPEVASGYPDRAVSKNATAAAELKTRTLTGLYNERPQWLVQAHQDLDNAVASAYGWPADISDDEIRARLLRLNLERVDKNMLDLQAAKIEAREKFSPSITPD